MRRPLLVMLIILVIGLAGCGRVSSVGQPTPTLSPPTQIATSPVPASATPTSAPPFAAPTAGAATATPPPSTATLDQPFEIAMGQQVSIGSDLVVTFVSVSEDSRCPKSVACVWSGAVTAIIKLEHKGQQAESFTLSKPNLPNRADHATYQNLTVQLLNVTPAPETPDRPIKQSEYVATLRVGS